MREVLTRRYRKVVSGEGKMPDLIMIDGGQGQLGVAIEVAGELGLNVPLLGVAKGVSRKPGMEQLLMAGREGAFRLQSDDPGLHLIQQIRDEAHRFAITGMRAKRAQVRTGASKLEDIAGIGPKKRAKLLQRFGGVRGVADASVQDLCAVEGISPELAQTIYQALR
jgi:excinuclease ABC subunit C